jgi:FkbM family methyltransferase
MNQILFKQINGEFIDLSVSEKFVEHYNKNNSFSKYIIDEEINSGIYDDEILNQVFEREVTVIDVGANVGLFSLHILPKASKIYCVEPTDSHFEVLESIATKFGSDKFILNKIALNNYDGTCSFQINESNTTENKIVQTESENKVKCLTLKSFLESNNINEVDFLKIDIEGGETEIFMNDPTLSEALKKCKIVYVECHPFPYGTIVEDELIQKMKLENFEHKSGKRTYSHYFFKK